jgi:hypothetical protein
MKYAFLIYGPETPEHVDNPEIFAGYVKFGEAVADRFRGAERLRTSESASTVRVRDGQTMITDGPYAETREQIAGIYFLECSDLDDATACAARIPSAALGAVEIRPIWDN